ncbi:MAG: 2-amino-4-hydroxy-6-hydroxymethyldihydropteridine diphosphokinase [Magnetococcus sp. WYHC-3]
MIAGRRGIDNVSCSLAEPVLLGLGANRRHPEVVLGSALAVLGQMTALRVLKVSRFHRSEPMGPVPQPWFVNAAALLSSSLPPRDLLERLLQVERWFGRNRAREVRWGPRDLDLDLLAYGDRLLVMPDLILPHPGLHRRRFVLAPLADIVPHWRHPLLHKSIDRLLHEVDDDSAVLPLPTRAATLEPSSLER